MLEPFSPSRGQIHQNGEMAGKNLKIHHLVDIPLERNYESLRTSVSTVAYIWLDKREVKE